MPGRILSREQIDNLLDYINVGKRRWKSNGEAVQFCCPIHNERTPSCGIVVSDQYFHCFACGEAGTFDYFLYRALPDEFKRISDAAAFIRTRYKVDVSLFNEDYKNRIMRYEDFFPENQAQEVRKVKPVYTLAPFMSGKETYQYFYDRGFNEDTVEKFMIGRDLENETVTIPVFWEDNQLAGVIGRYIFPRSRAERYKVYNFERGNLLFPIDKYEPEEDNCILVEGVFDAIKMNQIGYRNCLALMTNSLTMKQRDMLIKSCNNVVLLLDNDERGAASTRNIINQLKDSVDIFTVTYPDHGKDPCDWSAREIWRTIGTKQNYYKRNLIRLE